MRERCCNSCGNVFHIERKRGRPRVYCFDCGPVGYQVIKKRGEFKRRLRPSLYRLIPKGGTVADVFVLRTIHE
jgi:hypothetical protein